MIGSPSKLLNLNGIPKLFFYENLTILFKIHVISVKKYRVKDPMQAYKSLKKIQIGWSSTFKLILFSEVIFKFIDMCIANEKGELNPHGGSSYGASPSFKNKLL